MTPSQVDKLEESVEKTYECPNCKDIGFLFFRVHKDTKWIEDKNFKTLIPKEMVSEEDFLAGRVCKPEDAWEWRSTYSRICVCAEKKRIERMLKSSEITDEFKKLDFENFITKGKPEVVKDAYECALEYYQEFEHVRHERRNSIALLGQPGAGKTHLLTAVSNHLINDIHVPVLYFPYVEGFNDLKDDFDKLEEKLNRMKKVEVLFIDDLFKPLRGKPRATEWQIEQTYAVINYRYLNFLPILISSELIVDELVEIDEALGSRIYQMCQDFTVVIEGDRKQLNHRLGEM